jgi:type III restriction enzyme
VDAIESGIVKIPRLPVMDVTGLPDPKYFKLWEKIREDLEPADSLAGKARKPKPPVMYREAEGALQQLAGQWKERFEYVQQPKQGQEHVPPVMIVVCDNTDLAELLYQKISGETQIGQVTQADIDEVTENGEEPESTNGKGRKKAKTRTSYGPSSVLPEFANAEGRNP